MHYFQSCITSEIYIDPEDFENALSWLIDRDYLMPKHKDRLYLDDRHQLTGGLDLGEAGLFCGDVYDSVSEDIEDFMNTFCLPGSLFIAYVDEYDNMEGWYRGDKHTYNETYDTPYDLMRHELTQQLKNLAAMDDNDCDC